MKASVMKRCTKCGEEKTCILFSKDRHQVDGLTSRCKPCMSAARRERKCNPKPKLPADMKYCSKCSKALPLSSFHHSKSAADGRKSGCKSCNNAAAKAYYHNHTEERCSYQRRRREADPDGYRAAMAERYANFSSEKKADIYRKSRQYIAENPELNRMHQAAYRQRSAESIRQRASSFVANLTDWYVRSVLFRDVPNPSRIPIPQSLIDAKREQLRIHRHLRKEKP